MNSEKLTFGKLPIGEKFICLPVEGDNSGHGGFKGAHYIFKKMDNESGLRKTKGQRSTFPSTMEIIHVKD